MICFELTIPPSVNRTHRAIKKNGGVGVIRSTKYTNWIATAGWEIQAARQPKMPGNYELQVLFPLNFNGDLDNRIKALSDLLQKQGVIENDKLCDSLRMRRDRTVPEGKCQVVITESVIRATGDGAAGGSALVRGRGPLVQEVAR